MTSGFISRRLALLAAVTSSLLLAACGSDSNDSGGNTNVRAINLLTDVPSVDLYTGDTKRFSALVSDTLSTYQNFAAGSYTLAVRKAGETTSLYSDSFGLAKDQHYTALITGRESGVVVRTLPEDENTANITAGNTRVRVFNLTSDTGGVDVFITGETVDIGDAAPTLRFTNNSLSDFIERPTGAARLRVTSVGNPADVRLDVMLTTLPEKNFSTLVLSSGPGGSLVNAALVAQQGAVTALKNSKARVRVAAGADSNGNVAATVGGTTLVGSLRSPSVSTYLLVNAGTQDLTMRVNGTVFTTGDRSFVAGADYTLLVYGNGATAQMTMLADDNRLPTTSTRAKLRLVNGVAGSEPMTMQLDFLPLASDILPGTASAYSTANSVGSTRIDVTSPNATDALFSATAASGQVLLQSQGVYTVFMLGGASTPTGVFRKDR